MTAALYARVSTLDQHTNNQLSELRRYAAARGWATIEFVDEGVSGAKESRPALDAMLKAARRREFDLVVCWRLDRLGRSLKHLIGLLDDLLALGVGFVSLGESIDGTTPSGRLHLHLLGAFAEFERNRIRERVISGLQRARAQGTRLGRPKSVVPVKKLTSVTGLPNAAAAAALGVSLATIKRWRKAQKSLTTAA